VCQLGKPNTINTIQLTGKTLDGVDAIKEGKVEEIVGKVKHRELTSSYAQPRPISENLT